MAAKKSGLGRGLSDLFEQNTAETEGGVTTLRLSELEPNREQPRKTFDEAAIAELADSISKHGLIQPLLVRPMISGGYQIVAGERRFRACRMAGLLEVPVVIKDLDDRETAEIALIENLQREDLNPVEEALGYKMLIDEYELTQDEVAKTVGKSRPVVSNALRLLNLPDTVLEKVKDGTLSNGQARSLLLFKDKEDMLAAARLAENDGLTVRELEKMAKQCNDTEKKGSEPKIKPTAPLYKEVEISLSELFGRKVSVKKGSGAKGMLMIEFFDEDDLKKLAKSFENIE